MISEHYHFLLDAYDRLGKHLFGPEWSGQEIQLSPVPPPEKLEESRRPLENKIAAFDARLAELANDRKRLLSESALVENMRKDATLIEERAGLLSQLSQMPEPDESYRNRYAAFRRRVVSEQRLVDALKHGALNAVMLGGFMVPDRLWHGAHGFKYYLDLSLVVMPRTESGRRRATLLVPKDQFESWLQGVKPEFIDEASPPSPEQLCRAWFRGLVRTSAGRVRKGDCLQEARENITGLSVRQFNRVWDNEAPPFWKSSGRPKNQ